ncbi:MAG: HAMP domain-containing protein [Rubrivivax sp.]|nr:HAMP domain-containing protein [Rubrivivax sp.]
MKLATKLIAAPVITAAAVLGVAQVEAWLAGRAMATAQTQSAQNFNQFRQLAQAQAQLGEVHVSVYRTVALMASLDDAKVQAFRADLKTRLKALEQGLATVSQDTEALKPTLAEASKQIAGYGAKADAAIDLATVDPNTGIAALQGADANFTQLAASLGQLVQQLQTHADSDAAEAKTAAGRLHGLLSALALLAAGGAVALGWRIQRRVVRDLGRAGRAADEIAAGRLGTPLRSDGQDEVAALLRSLEGMRSALVQSLRTVHESTQSIGQASREIAAGNTDLSHRTEQTASNLQQTASSMTQLTGTVRQSSESAAQANQLAHSAAEVAQRGGAVVAQVVTTMDEINHSSKKIADIIGTIDGIAFQTNILALNAAVEAARAGEQGRGFAVVAAEVRSLAGRSAEAAREIKALIATSVEKVEAGSALVGQAGSTMTEIVASVQRVSDIIGEISAAAAEQTGGIGQVNGAVGELDRMTQQNAALVEESAAAAESLREQAERLGGVVAAFELDDTGRG